MCAGFFRSGAGNDGLIGHVRWQKLGAAEMLPLRINAGGEVHLIFGLSDLEGFVLGQPVVVAECGKAAV